MRVRSAEAYRKGEGLLAASLPDRPTSPWCLYSSMGFSAFSVVPSAAAISRKSLLPVDASSLGDHGRRDLGEGLVQLVLLVGVVNEDQVGFEV